MIRPVNAAGIALIKAREGCKLDAYPDPATGKEPWTIGYGHTGADVHPGLTITQAQAESMLSRDLAAITSRVARLVLVDLSDNAFAALCAFAYNLGCSALARSTLLKLVNLNQMGAAADQFLLWDHDHAGHVLPGLLTRRQAERELFLQPDGVTA
jgi:lysozyme